MRVFVNLGLLFLGTMRVLAWLVAIVGVIAWYSNDFAFAWSFFRAAGMMAMPVIAVRVAVQAVRKGRRWVQPKRMGKPNVTS